jgi:thiol-disulfide isomerase/thioredoxin
MSLLLLWPVAAAMFGGLLSAVPRGDDAHARALLGQPAPALPRLTWLDGKARTLASLAGQVVVIRNFTTGCPYCEGTLPALERIHQEWKDRQVVVLGVFHPKPPRPAKPAEAAAAARELGASFPVAVDPQWALVNSWWLQRTPGTWTSITWVLDRRGRIRFVHPGGEYHPGGGPEHARCRSDEAALRKTIADLVAEQSPRAASR